MRALLLGAALGLVAPVAGQTGSSLGAAGHAVFELLRQMRGDGYPEATTPPPEGAIKKAGMVEAITEQCKTVPGLFAAEWKKQSGCVMNSTEMFEMLSFYVRSVSNAHVDGMEGAHDPAVAAHFQATTHDVVENFCGNAECHEGHRHFSDKFAECYADAMCGIMASSGKSRMPFTACQSVVGKMLTHAIDTELDTKCMKEPRQSVYCSEVDTMLLTENPRCYQEVHSPVRGCSPACAAAWEGLKGRFPVCTDVLADKIIRYQHMALFAIQSLRSQPSGAGLLSAVVARPFGEVCTDMGGHSGPGPATPRGFGGFGGVGHGRPMQQQQHHQPQHQQQHWQQQPQRPMEFLHM